MKKTTQINHKKGAASLYVVIFTTLLLGIITIGFIRIMLSESSQTSNSDLSQSAYDSALAGIEDAKVAVLKYHECISEGATASSASDATSCERIIAAMEHENADTDCDLIRKILTGRDGENETIVQSEDGAGSDMDQAYTCVLVSEINDEYLGQLNTNYHSKIVPLRAADINGLEYVRIQWYSDDNATSSEGGTAITNIPYREENSLSNTNKPANYNDIKNTELFPALNTSNPYAPPTLGVQLIQSATTFKVSDFNTSVGDRTNRGTLLLYPSANAGASTIRSSSTEGFVASATRTINTPTAVNCADSDTTAVYYCSTIIQIPDPVEGSTRSEASSFLRLFLPYGNPETDFSVSLCRDINCNQILPFLGVQTRIDSTGRANDLFRRVESRVELVDVYFPYPEYSATLKGNEVDAINKNFWITYNSWGNKNSDFITEAN